MTITNLTNRNGNAIKNQYLIIDKNTMIFQSYKSKIIEYKIRDNLIKIYREWDYSNTTRKYFYQCINDFCDSNFSQAEINRGMIEGYLTNSKNESFAIAMIV